MSFQRDLTGSSNLYANIILNTNVCASTVSTVNLSATNASFTNITTNTWTTGNVSTPNVIATNAYFSNLNTCNFNVCNLSTSTLYSSNASFTNVSITTQLTVPNISTLQTINGATALRLQNNGGIVVKDRDTSDPALIQLNYASTPSIETYGMYLETNKSGTRAYARIGAGENTSLQFYADTVIQAQNTSTTGWNFYSSINTSYRVNFSNLSVSTLSASSLGLSSLNVCNLYVYGINDVKDIASNLNLCILTDNLVIRDFGNGSTNLLLNYDDATFTETNGLKFEIGVSGANMSVQDTLPFTLFSGNVSQLTNVSNIGFSFFRPIYASQLYISNISARRLQVTQELGYSSAFANYTNSISQYAFYASAQWASISALSGVSAIYTCIYCSNLSVSNLSATNFQATNFSVTQDLDVGDAINAFRMFTSQLDVSNIDVSNRIDANRVVLTLSLDAPISNVSDARVSSIRGVSASFTSIFTSELNTCILSAPSFIATSINCSNLSVSYLHSTSGNFLVCNATNISSTGIVTTSYFSNIEANISTLTNNRLYNNNASLGDVTVNSRYYYLIGSTQAYEHYATNGVLSGAVFYNTLDTATARHRFQYVGDDLLSINNSQIIAYKNINSASSINASSSNICNASINNLSLTTLTVTNYTPTNFSTTNLSVATALTATSATITTLNSTSINASSSNICNASINNLSATTLTATNFNPANISTTNLSVATALTSTSATIDRLSSTSMFVSNLSASNISVPGRISVSNISATSISATGRINANNFVASTDITATGAVQGNTGSFFSIAVSTLNASNISAINTSSSTMATSTLNACNTSITNLSTTAITGTTINATTVNFSTLAVSNPVVNLSVSSLAVSQATFHTSGGVSTYGTVTLVNQKMIIQSVGLAATGLQLGNSGNIRFEVSVSGVSSYVPFSASTGNFSILNVSTFSPANITTTTMTASTVNGSTGNFSTLNVSTFSPANITTTTMTASTVNGSTGNFSILNVSTFPATISTSTVNTSTLNVCNASILNISNMNTMFSTGAVTMTNDALYLRNTYASLGGAAYIQMDYWKSASSVLDRGFTMYCDEGRGSVIDGGTLPLEWRQDDITQLINTSTAGWTYQNKINSSYQTNLSKLAVSNMSLSGTANISTLNVCTFNASNIILDNASIITQDSTTINVSTINSSLINNASGTFTTLSNNTIYSSIINVSRINNTSAYVSNLSVSNLSVVTGNITNFSSSTVTITNSSITNLSVVTALTVPNSVSSNTSNTTFRIHANSTNTQTTGLITPNYIDGLDLTTGLFLGYNHTGGFINFNRVLRCLTNITLDGNVNQVVTTNNLGFGRNQTTGNIYIGDGAMTGNVCINTSGDIVLGNTAMGGNISIDTAGDVVFGCDRRSTWNTSGLIKNSTQLGSFYQQTIANTINKTNTGQTFVFSPGNANTSLTVSPVGLYLVSGMARIKTFSGYNASVTGYNAGICYGGTYNFTSGNTTRIAYAALGALNTSGTNNYVECISFTGVINMSIANQYIGAFMSVTSAQAATVGNMDCVMEYCTVVKIA